MSSGSVYNSPLRAAERAAITVFALVLGLAGLACRSDMQDQPRYKAYGVSDFFDDGVAGRHAVDGTVARGQLNEDVLLYTGRNVLQRAGEAPAALATTFPFQITEEILDRGQERYKVFCSVCHGPTGIGDGMVVRRGFRAPPSYHIDRLREAPVGHYFDVITNGFGAMPSYAAKVGPRDRWAIVAYIRALQLSQRAQISDVPQEAREQLEAGGQK